MRAAIGVIIDHTRSAAHGKGTDSMRRNVRVGIVVNLEAVRASVITAVRAVKTLSTTQKRIVSNY